MNKASSKPASLPNSVPPPDGWPEPLNDDGFYGVAGDFARLCGPHTEADPVAIVTQVYAGFGNQIGNRPHVKVQFARQTANIFLCLAGDSAKARKGTSWEVSHSVLHEIDSEWSKSGVVSGLSSGEGLIAAIQNGNSGPGDKRVLFLETEACRTFKAMGRHGNTLSPVLRQAWERTTLRVTTKNNPLIATDAHVSFIAHTTVGDLDENLPTLELTTGLGNRILWAAVRRPHLLPWSGKVPTGALTEIAERLKRAALQARGQNEIKFTHEARQLWVSEYARLSSDRGGVLGAVTARSESQVLRLALICALMNESSTIKTFHLRAALAISRYCFDSAKFLFSQRRNGRFSKPELTPNRVLGLLRNSASGMTRTTISNGLNNHFSAEAISAVLQKLKEQGCVYVSTEKTAGRSAERWFAIIKGEK
jgi:hypothetical protein